MYFLVPLLKQKEDEVHLFRVEYWNNSQSGSTEKKR
jgi:hypothetical protein